MNPFSNTRVKRSTAFGVLLVWLFAVVSGVANACLLEVPGPHSQAAGTAGTGHAPTVSSAHTVDGHDEDSGTSKEPCLKVCDEGSKAPVKLHAGIDLTDPGMAPLVAIVWTAAARVVSGSLRLDDLQPPIVGPPFRVRYSRLTL